MGIGSARSQRIKAHENVKKHGRAAKAPFSKLPHFIQRSEAYYGLSVFGRTLLLELIVRYNGCNNGMIALGLREAAYELHVGQETIRRAFIELDDAGLVIPITPGNRIGRCATQWRLTWLRCDKTHELPRQQWTQRKPYEPKAPKPKAPMTDAERARRYRDRKRHLVVVGDPSR
jgi:hypothetical protein